MRRIFVISFVSLTLLASTLSGYWIGRAEKSAEIEELQSLCERTARERDAAARIMERHGPKIRPVPLPTVQPNLN